MLFAFRTRATIAFGQNKRISGTLQSHPVRFMGHHKADNYVDRVLLKDISFFCFLNFFVRANRDHTRNTVDFTAFIRRAMYRPSLKHAVITAAANSVASIAAGK